MLEHLTPLTIRGLVGDKVYARAEQYARQGYVTHLRLMGDTLHGVVQGHSYEPYHVRVRLAGGDVRMATCTCPYVEEYGALCKHVAAVLLVARRQSPARSAALEAQLDSLDAPALRALVLRLLDAAPELLEHLDDLLDPDTLEAGDAEAFLPLLPDEADAPYLQIPRLLEEGRHDEALAALGKTPDEALALLVGEAVAESHPDWVIARALPFVETHVAAGRSDRYDEAARWLMALRRAHLGQDQPAAWRETLGEVRMRFRRKWGFIQALEAHLADAHAAE